MLRITNLIVPVEDDRDLFQIAADRLGIPRSAVMTVRLVRRAVDARRKPRINFVYTLDVEVDMPEGVLLARLAGDRDISKTALPLPETVTPGDEPLPAPPVVVGAGPAGLFAAIKLAEYGYRPIVLERGKDVERRTADVLRFWASGELDLESNVQFGEGGAGAFSDGKLTTRVHDPASAEIIRLLVEAGAPDEIAWLHKPHIGTDRLRIVVRNLRRKLVELGGTIRFETRLDDIETVPGKGKQVLKALAVNGGQKLLCRAAILCPGHSARDTYAMLADRRVAIAPKPFAIGLRVEHPQALIDAAQYGAMAGHPRLGPADYSLVFHDRLGGRTAFSFCMCPGGQVIAAASETGGVVTNGMSLYARSSGTANSAIVVNVAPDDWGGSPLGGVALQRHYEQLAFAMGGGGYCAPAERLGQFLGGMGRKGTFFVNPTYRPGCRFVDLAGCLPDFVVTTLRRAFPAFDRRVRGFADPGAVLTGVETRTSAPLWIVRDAGMVSVSTDGLYPAGEGAGYAGGIMSAAIDGLRAALAVIRRFKAP